MGLTVPQLNTCCCGCTLRTGTLIILWIYLVIGALTAVAPYTPSNSSSPQVKINDHFVQPQQEIFQKLGILFTVVGLFQVVISALGLYGVYKEIPVYLLPFLIGEIVLQVIQLIGFIFGGAGSTLLGEIISLLIFLYLWLVVFSHYRVLKGTARPIQA